MDINSEVELFDCPLCGGPGLLEEDNGWCIYAVCLDCGCHTAGADFKTPEGRLEAAKKAAHFWNIGKVLADKPGE